MKKILVFLLLLIPINTLSLTKSTYFKDINSDKVFICNNCKEKRLIASTTKIMTAILAIENKDLTDVVKVGDEVLTMYGSNIYLEKGESILLLDLIYGLMLRSGNDSAIVIANYVGGTVDEFIKMMNDKAKSIGMKNTSFENPHGLDDETKNYSTAEDLGILYSYAYKNKAFSNIVSTKKYETSSSIKKYIWFNRNEILEKYNFATGGKTGYTPDAGRILVTSANKNNIDVVGVSFSNDYEYQNQIDNYENIFNSYKLEKIIDKKEKINNNSYPKEDFYYPLQENEREYINIKIKNNKINIYIKEDKIGDIDIEKIKMKENNVFDKIKLFFKKLA